MAKLAWAIALPSTILATLVSQFAVASDVVEALLPPAHQWCMASHPLTRKELEQPTPDKAQPGERLLQAALTAIGEAAIEARLQGFGKPEIASYEILKGDEVSVLICSLVATDRPPPTSVLISRMRPALKVFALACKGSDIETCDAELTRQLRADPWRLAGAALDNAERLSATASQPADSDLDPSAALNNVGAFIADTATGSVMPAPLEGSPITVSAIVAPENPW